MVLVLLRPALRVLPRWRQSAPAGAARLSCLRYDTRKIISVQPGKPLLYFSSGTRAGHFAGRGLLIVDCWLSPKQFWSAERKDCWLWLLVWPGITLIVDCWLSYKEKFRLRQIDCRLWLSGHGLVLLIVDCCYWLSQMEAETQDIQHFQGRKSLARVLTW